MFFLRMCAFGFALVSLTLSASAAEPKSEEQKAFYALGVALARNLASFNLTPAELELVKAGLTDESRGEATIDLETYIEKIGELQSERVAAQTRVEREAGQAFRTKAAAQKGAITTPSGIVIQHIKTGSGASPTAQDTVTVHYQGTTTDGTVFDSSRERDRPETFPLEAVIPCWTEALQTMKAGGQSRIICPPELAYGDRGAPPIKPGATLVFDVELLEVQRARP
ncbi:MAG: FKBP-type peptidyl-prolyl cis-trans isomerase [Gammaproteobacteria bacterium]|nr:peptidylprolyl isomerase [Gammaproteobacteria bacterium]